HPTNVISGAASARREADAKQPSGSAGGSPFERRVGPPLWRRSIEACVLSEHRPPRSAGPNVNTGVAKMLLKRSSLIRASAAADACYEGDISVRVDVLVGVVNRGELEYTGTHCFGVLGR